MRLISKQNGYEIWAKFDFSAKVYELFWDIEGESYTGWAVDSLQDAVYIAPEIFANME
jgi:hypothetical protein